MNKNPKFSIIVPVYNVEKYLCFCLDSLINQSLKDIEIICVNDGSTDSSLSILREYEKLDERIIVIDKNNGGLSSARNAGLDVAEGEYILYVDSDDYLGENTCDRLYMEILQENPDIIVFGTNIFPWIASSEHISWLYKTLNVETKQYENNSIKALFNEQASKPFVWNECYRREIIERHHIRFDENLRYGEDMLYLFMIFPRTCKVGYIQDKLYFYRCERENSLMDHAKHNEEWKLQMHISIVEKILQDWEENNYINQEMDSLYLWCIDFFVYDVENMLLTKEYKKNYAIQYTELLKKYGLCFEKKDEYHKKMELRLEKLANG